MNLKFQKIINVLESMNNLVIDRNIWPLRLSSPARHHNMSVVLELKANKMEVFCQHHILIF